MKEAMEDVPASNTGNKLADEDFLMNDEDVTITKGPIAQVERFVSNINNL